jgi:peptidoglycan/xylan/chitin deacetylase (PgdA/CDA1 family)/membrane-associated phospholipid phosphatase
MSAELPPPAFTLRALLDRVLADAPLKALGTTLGMTGFFVLYFAVQNHPLFPVTTVPETWLDHALGFQAWSLLPYFSLWFYISLVPALLVDRRQILGFAAGCAVLAAAGLALFLLWPTSVTAPAIDWSLHPGFSFLKQADAAGNACPSLHAAFAVFTALWFARLLPALGAGRLVQAANLLWAALIVYSTLGTKQHVALDALCGAILGAWVAALNLAALPPPPGTPSLRRPLFTAVAVIKISALLLWTSGIPFGFCLALFLSGGALVLHQIFVPHAGELVRVRTRFTPSDSTPSPHAPASPPAPSASSPSVSRASRVNPEFSQSMIDNAAGGGAREIWLTLDDGPDPDDTPRILDLLDRHQARATFFLVGQRAARHPALVSEISRRGHEIAHHSHTHPVADFWCAGPARTARELDRALAVFAAALPAGTPPPRRFRAPVGFKNLFLAPALRARGLDCVGWTLRGGDTFARDPAAVAARVARRLVPGAIILLHEGPPLRPAVRVAALAAVLDLLRACDYRAVIPPAEALR